MRAENERTERGRGRARRAALTMLARAFPGRLSLIAGLALLAGALPAIFAILVGAVVGALPAAVAGGLDSPDGRRVVVALAAIGLVLLFQEVVVAARGIASTDLYRRYDEHLLSRVMASTLSVPRLDLFEDPELAAKTDRAVQITRFGPGELVSGLSAKWSVLARGLSAAVLVATVYPVAAVALGLVWLAVGRQLQADYYRANPFWADPFRRAAYLKELALMPAWAKELRIFGLVDWLGDQFGRQWSIVFDELWRARKTGRRQMLALLAVALVANAIVLALAARSALLGTLGAGPLTVLVQGLFGMALLADQEGDIWIENGAIPAPDVLALERSAASLDSRLAGGIAADGHPAREIRFEGVRFAYPGRDAPVFDGLDLTIETGRSLAIVGLNGAGKTTLAKLLVGLEVPEKGRITVDGLDLAELDPTSWRRAVAAIFQDFVRYELSARDNVGFGAVEAMRESDFDERLERAARQAGADAVIADLPSGLDTTLSRRFRGGVDLSGGQWQRIALARALFAVEAGARVLVLDEPTAHLDIRAEADLYDRFLDLTRGLTTIVISHRFSTVRRADRVVVLDRGRIVEDGSHDDLVGSGGLYARLFRKQAMRYGDARLSEGDDDG